MEWFPTRFFDETRPLHPYALVILNQPIDWAIFSAAAKFGTTLVHLTLKNIQLTHDISAEIIVCADGGANHLFDAGPRANHSAAYVCLSRRRFENANQEKPQLICH